MNGGLIAARYAKALLEYAYERDSAEEIYEQMNNLASNFIKAPTMHRVLKNPMLSSTQKAGLLFAAVGNQPGEVFKTFTNMVLSNRREDHFQSIAIMYVELYRKRNSISIASLITASTIASEVEERLRDKIVTHTKGTLEFDSKVNPDILGGFIFEMNYMRLDASVSTELANIKDQLSHLNSKSAS